MKRSAIQTDNEPLSATVVSTDTSLRDIATVFLRLGTTAFGGPAAHIAMMDEQFVRRYKWLTEQEFLDYLSATNFIPGPNSTEMAIHIGHRRGGWPGLVVAGTCFILPAALIVGLLAWLYVRFGSLPQANGIFYGVKPVVIAVIVQALWRLGRSAIKTQWLGCVSAACLIMSGLGVNELIVLAAGGLLAVAADWRQFRLRSAAFPVLFSSSFGTVMPSAGLWPIFLVFAKIGSVLFGSGYVLLAFLRADLVVRYHWLTEKQLLDAVAVGQVTPGPVFTTATFIGYLLQGSTGALVATLGIFLPAFFFVALTAPIMPRLRRSRTAGLLLDGINVASLALMAVVTVQLAKTAVVDWITLTLAIGSIFLLLRFRRLSSAWLVLIAASAGFGKTMLTH